MNKEFIPYEQALELKELGFDESCFAWYNKNGVLLSDVSIGYESSDYLYSLNDMDDDSQCIAPLYQQAFRWFREKYQLYAWVKVEYEYGGVTPTYYITGKRQSDISSGAFNTYEEAELACLKKLIELVKQNT